VRKFSLMVVLLSCIFLLSSPAFADISYRIKTGDSLYKISKKFRVSIAEIKDTNKLESDHMKPGTKIIIPMKDKKYNTRHHRSGVKQNSLVSKTEDRIPDNKVADDLYHYTVRKGDTFSVISKKFSVPVNELKEINELKSTKLKLGQQLLVKSTGPRTYAVRKGDTIYKIARRFDIDVDELKDINGLETDSLKSGQKLFLEPEAETSEFTNHEAILSETKIDKEIPDIPKPEDLTLKDRLILFAKKFINIPYRFGGNSIFGIDCSGYVQKVYSMIGINLPRSAREQFHEGEPVETNELSIGDLVFFKTYASFPSHVGIYLGDNLFIHASSKGRKVTIDSLTEPFYIKRFIGAKRVLKEES